MLKYPERGVLTSNVLVHALNKLLAAKGSRTAHCQNQECIDNMQATAPPQPQRTWWELEEEDALHLRKADENERLLIDIDSTTCKLRL